jgi:hypothetical protein
VHPRDRAVTPLSPPPDKPPPAGLIATIAAGGLVLAGISFAVTLAGVYLVWFELAWEPIPFD